MAKKTRRVVRHSVHGRIRAKVEGNSLRPRLAVFRSLKHIYAQLVDDVAGTTVAAAATTEDTFKGRTCGNVAAAKEIGRLIAQRAKQKGIKTVVFDRGGYIYHGRVKSLAEAAREAGLEF
jgi:large subunit ribosomal protein L18